jgi:cytoskeletal protein CcmA (bactofilin family)
VVFLFIIGAVGFSFLALGGYEGDSVEGRMRDMKIFWKGEEAISKAYAWANINAHPAGTFTTASTGEFYAEYTIDKVADNRALRYRVSAQVLSDRRPGVLLSLTSLIQAKVASSLFFLEDHANNVFYYTGDTIDGPVHTNTQFAIAGTPVFKGNLFESGYPKQNGFAESPFFPCTPQIQTKIQRWGGPSYSFDSMATLINKVSAPVFNPSANQVVQIVFRNGLYSVSYKDKKTSAASAAVNYPLPASGGMYINGDVEVQGVLQGQVTVGASGNIIITDNLRYASANRVSGEPYPGCQDMLGLIAQQNVQVHQEQLEPYVGGGIVIDAVIVALNTSFEVTNYKNYSKPMGVMSFWGSIAQYERGVIGSVKKNGRRNGYVKSWHYDQRLSQAVPPYFPPLIDTNTKTMRFDQIYWSCL